MPAIVEAIIAIAGLLAALVVIFTPKGRRGMGIFLANLVSGAIDALTPILGEFGPELQAIEQKLVSAFNTWGGPIAADLATGFEGFARTVLEKQKAAVAGIGKSTPDNALDAAARAFEVAFGAGLSSAGVTALFESIFPEKLNTLNGIGPILAKMAGFDEVADSVLTPLYEKAFGKSLQYEYNSLFKPEYPGEFDATIWRARGLIGEDDLKEIFKYSPLKAKFETAYLASAFRAVSPFIVARAAETGAITNDDLRDVLTFGGYRKVDQERLIAAFNEAAIDPYKKQALSALITAAERGIVNGPDIETGLDQLNVIEPARFYIKLTIGYRRLEQLDTLYRKSVSEGYKFGTISDQEYIPAMENAGINEADAAAHYAVDSIAKHGRAAIAAARLEEKLANERRRAAVQAAEAEFFAGNIDAPGLSAAVLAAGVDPTVATFTVAIATARKQLRLRWVYGLELPPDQAGLLKEQVAVIEEQTIKKLIDPQSAIAQLAALGIPGPERENLAAKWAAQADKLVLPLGQ